LEALNAALDIVEISAAHRVRVPETARVYFEVGTRIGFDWLRARIEKLAVDGPWQAIARTGLRDAALRVQRRLSERVLARSERGQAGRELLGAGVAADVAFTSVLKRAIRTLWIMLDEMDRMWIPVERSWRLNERHYGALQGLNKAETAARHGEDQVKIWRRSYDIAPPPLASDDPRHPRLDPRYAGV